MYGFEMDIEIAEHNQKTMELNRKLVKTPREIEREKEKGESFSLNNSIKNFKTDAEEPKELFVYKPEV